MALMQKHRRKERHTGGGNHSIGFAIYKVPKKVYPGLYQSII
ncbi:hypothetical protein L345_17319 [Ophiophagus hannah]|uniref:Peptidase C2 calpain large subunit domain-containing protein n=1 Tax=Ophiophagus hannah TaxID=8665 RepID=V8N3Y9_OPHHA|nr:hypothetical protein L345_17319 [Ophiophagus hannah]